MKELLRFVSVISIAISLFSCASENIFSEENLEQSNIENVQIVRDFEVEITAPIPGVWKRMVEIGYTVKTGDAIGIIENDKGIFMIEVPDKDGKEISGIVTEIVTEDENSVVLDQGLIVITVEGELSAKSILVIPGILKSQEKEMICPFIL